MGPGYGICSVPPDVPARRRSGRRRFLRWGKVRPATPSVAREHGEAQIAAVGRRLDEVIEWRGAWVGQSSSPAEVAAKPGDFAVLFGGFDAFGDTVMPRPWASPTTAATIMWLVGSWPRSATKARSILTMSTGNF